MVSSTASLGVPASPGAPVRPAVLAWGALGLALAGLAGSLCLTWGLHLKACPLCFYQRSFMMGLVAVLGVGLLARAESGMRLASLALPLAVAGLGVASFHVWLEATDKLECPPGLLRLGTAPKQSLAVFALVSALLLAESLRGLALAGGGGGTLAAGVVIGLMLAAASCTSNPPMPAAPRTAYPNPPEVCRPPFHSPVAPTSVTP